MLAVPPVITYSQITAKTPAEIVSIREAIRKSPNSRWRRLVAEYYDFGIADLVGHDIAEVSLACSEGLPYSQPRGRVLRSLDAWAREVREQTENWWGEFKRNPGSFQNSPNRFRMVVLHTVHSCGLKVSCNPSYMGESDKRDCRYLFLHGPLTGFGGTCGTLAALFTAVGRRLGYPLWLVKTHDHLFVRWEARSGERFNIECTTPGFISHTDLHYRTWTDATVTDLDVVNGRLSASLQPNEELAFFLYQRALCLGYNLLLDEAEEATFHAKWLAPSNLQIYVYWQTLRAMRRLIRLADERGNREGPLSIAVEGVPCPTSSDPWEVVGIRDARAFIAQLRQHRTGRP